MIAVVYEEFGGPIELRSLPDPVPLADGVVIRVEATGLCRSDWHGWRGHDPDITNFPHVPGHEFAGTVIEVGREVKQSHVGQRVTAPFVLGCGSCDECRRGNQQICDRQFQPGFNGWGSFAEYVTIPFANENLVALPDEIPSVAAAALGCRVATAYRAVASQGRLQPGEWVTVHGCGGAGLSAVAIAAALGAHVIAVDIRPEPLELAKRLGAVAILNGRDTSDISDAIREMTQGGAGLSLDTLGSVTTLSNSIRCLRKQGRHVQVGHLTDQESIPSGLVRRIIGWELSIVGSHGLPAHAYPSLLELIQLGKLDPMLLIDRIAPLEDAPGALQSMDQYRGCGVTVFKPITARLRCHSTASSYQG